MYLYLLCDIVLIAHKQGIGDIFVFVWFNLQLHSGQIALFGIEPNCESIESMAQL
jgi:hypothetical protein